MFQNCFKISKLQTSFTMYKWVIMYMMGESKKKKFSCAKVKVLSKDYIFQVAIFLLVFIAFFTQFLKLNRKFEAKYDI
jgi:hypothetical protein